MKFIAISEVHLVTFKLELEMLVPLLQKSKFTALGCPEFLHTASVAASIEASTFIVYASIMLEWDIVHTRCLLISTIVH